MYKTSTQFQGFGTIETIWIKVPQILKRILAVRSWPRGWVNVYMRSVFFFYIYTFTCYCNPTLMYFLRMPFTDSPLIYCCAVLNLLNVEIQTNPLPIHNNEKRGHILQSPCSNKKKKKSFPFVLRRLINKGLCSFRRVITVPPWWRESWGATLRCLHCDLEFFLWIGAVLLCLDWGLWEAPVFTTAAKTTLGAWRRAQPYRP